MSRVCKPSGSAESAGASSTARDATKYRPTVLFIEAGSGLGAGQTAWDGRPLRVGRR